MKLMSKNVKDYKMQQLFQYQNKKTAEKNVLPSLILL